MPKLPNHVSGMVRNCAWPGWLGFHFLELTASELRDAPLSPITPRSGGTLMLKYVPRTGAWGEADAHQVTLTPADDPDRTVELQQAGVGAVRIHRAAWSDLPTTPARANRDSICRRVNAWASRRRVR